MQETSRCDEECEWHVKDVCALRGVKLPSVSLRDGAVQYMLTQLSHVVLCLALCRSALSCIVPPCNWAISCLVVSIHFTSLHFTSVHLSSLLFYSIILFFSLVLFFLFYRFVLSCSIPLVMFCLFLVFCSLWSCSVLFGSFLVVSFRFVLRCASPSHLVPIPFCRSVMVCILSFIPSDHMMS